MFPDRNMPSKSLSSGIHHQMWNRDLKLKMWLIAVTGIMAFALMLRHGMRFDFASSVHAAGTIGLLLPFALVFDSRRLDQFANLLTGFLCMVAFNFFLSVLTYAGTPLNAPLADEWFVRMDQAMGIDVAKIVTWSRSHPVLYRFFDMTYYSVLPSTLLALIVLGFDRDVTRLRDFVLHFMLGGFITTIIFFFLPAEAPEGHFNFQPTQAQQNFLNHFYALRSGEFRVISMNNLEGLITFPSFHTTWAVLVAYAFRHSRWLFPPMLFLNGAVVLATVILGWHYAADVIGGVLTAGVAVAIARITAGWRFNELLPPTSLQGA
ncbi:MAG: phosphatase PAP2 family protein [Planctomycetaceae bacterium]